MQALGAPRDLERVRPVLAALAPELAAAPLRPVLRHHEGDLVPSETVLVGEDHVLKVAWTGDDAASIRRQRAVLGALALPVATPTVLATGDAPVAALLTRLPGRALTYAAAAALDDAQVSRLAGDWAGMVAALQAPATLAAVEAVAGPLRTPADVEPDETPDAIRATLLPLRREPWLPALVDEAEATLRPSAPRVLLHADLGGHNLLVGDGPRITGLIDVEQVCAGDPVFDLRHLLAQAPEPDLCAAVLARLATPVDPERVIAAHVLLDLGDIARRTRRGEPVTGGADARIAAIPARVSAARQAFA